MPQVPQAQAAAMIAVTTTSPSFQMPLEYLAQNVSTEAEGPCMLPVSNVGYEDSEGEAAHTAVRSGEPLYPGINNKNDNDVARRSSEAEQY